MFDARFRFDIVSRVFPSLLVGGASTGELLLHQVSIAMPLRKETLYISETPIGWTVNRHDGKQESGPYFDREKAVACALAIAKGTHAQNVRVSREIGHWSVEWLHSETPRG